VEHHATRAVKPAVDHHAANDVRADAQPNRSAGGILKTQADDIVESLDGHHAGASTIITAHSARRRRGLRFATAKPRGYLLNVDGARPLWPGAQVLSSRKVALIMLEELKQKLGEEVEKLQYELNVTLPQEIRKAVEHGDLRENSEYKAALERQQFVQARLGQLRQRLSKLSSIDPSQIPTDRIGLGSKAIVEDEKTGEKETYYLVFGDAIEFEEGHVTMASPIGRALLGKAVGEVAFLRLPTVVRQLRVVRLKTIHDAEEIDL